MHWVLQLSQSLQESEEEYLPKLRIWALIWQEKSGSSSTLILSTTSVLLRTKLEIILVMLLVLVLIYMLL